MRSVRGRPVAVNVALALAYAALGVATLELGESGGVELRRVIWVSSGLAITAGLLLPFPVWLGAGLGGALATLVSGSSAVLVIGTGVANGLEVWLSVFLLRRLRFVPALERVDDVLLLVGVASGFAALGAAVVSVAALAISGLVPAGAHLRLLVMWWLTHAMGIVVVTPVGLTLTRAFRWRGRHLELAIVLLAVAAAAWVPFSADPVAWRTKLFFLPFPLLLWAAVRLPVPGVAAGGAIAATCALVAAVRNTGPFTGGSPNDTLVLTWLFTNIVTVGTIICAALAVGMDRARTAHQAGEMQLRAVLDTTSEGIVVADEHGTITNVNRAVSLIWPDSLPLPQPGQPMGTILSALATILGRDSDREVLAALPANRGRISTMSMRDGRVWEVSVDRPSADHAHTGLIWSFRDISEQMRAEGERQELQAQVLHGQKLESLGVMAGGIAHDFNNLLMAIRGRAELIEGSGDLPVDVREDVDGILRTADEAAALCRQMLVYAGRGVLEVRPMDLSRCAREIQELLRVSVSREVTLQLDLTPSPLWVEGDVTQLRQVMLNLVTNASDAVAATRRGGVVRVATRRATLDGDWLSRAVTGADVAPGEFAILEVSDNGIGIENGAIRQIFDPFFSSKGAGRGLGLSSTLGIVRGHGGALSLESHRDVGTRFQVAFPLSTRSAPSTEGAEEPPREVPLGGRTVLVVDDDPAVRRIVTRLLTRMGITVREACDGDDALAQLEGNEGRSIDLVLLDLTMPNKSGRATHAAMRERGLTTPVILTSGFSAEGMTFDDGIAGFVEKPFRRDTLLRAIEVALQRGGEGRPGA